MEASGRGQFVLQTIHGSDTLSIDALDQAAATTRAGVRELWPRRFRDKPGMTGKSKDSRHPSSSPDKSLSVIAQTQESDQTFSAVSTMSRMV